MRKLICFLLMAFLVLAASPASYASSVSSAQEAYLYGDYNTAVNLCLESLEKEITDEALYFAGLSFLKLGRYDRARNYFRSLLSDFKSSKFYDTALVKLVDTYFLENNLDKAETLYRSVLEKHPSLSTKPLVYLRLAQVSAKKGNWPEKNRYLNLIKTNFSNSLENRFAKRLSQRGNFFTVQVGAFSKKNNASVFAKRLRPKYPVYIVEEKEEGLVLYKVRVGKFKEKIQVQELYQRLKQEGYPARIYP